MRIVDWHCKETEVHLGVLVYKCYWEVMTMNVVKKLSLTNIGRNFFNAREV